MFRLAMKGFWGSINGRIYLFGLTLTFVFIILEVATDLLLNSVFVLLNSFVALIFIVATIQYSYYMKLPIWKIVLFVALMFIPIGTWVPVVLLYADTYAKEKRKHPEFDNEESARQRGGL